MVSESSCHITSTFSFFNFQCQCGDRHPWTSVESRIAQMVFNWFLTAFPSFALQAFLFDIFAQPKDTPSQSAMVGGGVGESAPPEHIGR